MRNAAVIFQTIFGGVTGGFRECCGGGGGEGGLSGYE